MRSHPAAAEPRATTARVVRRNRVTLRRVGLAVPSVVRQRRFSLSGKLAGEREGHRRGRCRGEFRGVTPICTLLGEPARRRPGCRPAGTRRGVRDRSGAACHSCHGLEWPTAGPASCRAGGSRAPTRWRREATYGRASRQPCPAESNEVSASASSNDRCWCGFRHFACSVSNRGGRGCSPARPTVRPVAR